MEETTTTENGSLLDQLKHVIQSGVDYAMSSLRLLQAQVAAMALSSVVFLVLIIIALLCVITAFVLFSVAFGVWLTHVTGSAGWALLIMGGIYTVLAAGTGGYALHWLKNLKS
jgi:hypothetical protein